MDIKNIKVMKKKILDIKKLEQKESVKIYRLTHDEITDLWNLAYNNGFENGVHSTIKNKRKF
jgi:hypothetical protein